MGQCFLQALPIFQWALQGGEFSCNYLLTGPRGYAPDLSFSGSTLAGNDPFEVCTVLPNFLVFC